MADKSGMMWELLRKAVHLSALLIVVAYTLLFIYFSERVAIVALTGLLLVLLEIEYVRLEHSSKILEIFNPIFRKKEKDHIAGSVFMVISCIICFAAFNYWIAVIALFMTVFGDLFAALVGKGIGKIKLFNGKTVEGTVAGFLANAIVGVVVLPDFLYIVIPMAVIATFVELITNKLDDNLTVPLFTGFAGQIIVYIAIYVLEVSTLLPEVSFAI